MKKFIKLVLLIIFLPVPIVSMLFFAYIGKSHAETAKVQEDLVLNINDAILGPGAYVDLIAYLDSLQEGDILTININSPGGSVFGGIPLVNALLRTKAKIKVNIVGGAFSMAAVIACTGDEIHMDPGTVWMFHDYSTEGLAGKGSEIIGYATSVSKQLTDILNTACYKVLTPEDIDNIMSGRDLYIHPEDAKRRLQGN